MADNPSNGNFTNYGIILAALVSASALFFPPFPALDMRPRSAEPLVHETASVQDVDARMWQDPFEVIARAVKNPQDPNYCNDHVSHCSPPIDQLRNSKQLEADENPVLLGVSVPGGPYPEDQEARRRTRYAVVSGLDVVNYVPNNARGIGYYVLQRQHDDAMPPPAIIPFELFEAKSAATPKKKIAVLWLNEDLAAGQPLLHFCRLLQRVDHQSQGMQVIGPRFSDTLRDLVKEVNGSTTTSDGVPDVCGSVSASLKRTNFYAYAATVEDRALLTGLNISDKKNIHDFLESKNIHLFRTVATDDVLARALVSELALRGVKPDAEDEWHIALISEWDTYYGQTFPCTLQGSFKNDNGVPCAAGGKDLPWVHRFTYLRGLDGALPESQKVDPPKGQGEDEKHSADKSPSDTKASDLPFGNGQFDYLRRLTGDLKSLDEELKSRNPRGISAIGVLGTDVFDKLQVLRALRFEFRDAIFFTTDLDEAFTIESNRKWTRNLIVASSFGPELERAFQGAIPPFRDSYQTAAFLSTQLAVLDAPVPPKAAPQDCGGGAGSTNTSLKILYGATATAPVTASATNNDQPKPWPAMDEQGRILQWLKHPLVFEVERSGSLLHMPRNAEQIQVNSKDCEKQNQSIASEYERKLKCANDIQPLNRDLFPSIDRRVRLGLSFFFGLGLFFVLRKAIAYKAILNRLRKKSHFGQASWSLTFADFTYGTYLFFLFLVVLLGVFLFALGFGWPWLAAWLTGYGDGEPMILSEGISLWPSIALRLFLMVISLFLIFLAWAQLDSNLNELAGEIRSKTSPGVMIRSYNNDIKNKYRSIFYKICKCFIVRPILGQSSATLYNIDTAWEQFVIQGRPFARFCRVGLCVLLMIGLCYILFSMYGLPINHGRSDIARTIYGLLTLFDVLLMFFLIFFVVDATYFCFIFVRQLAKGPTLWPEKTRTFFKSKLGFDDSLAPKGKHNVLDDWIDLYFIAKRTDCINTLIYYPFAVIALMMVSRSAVFGDFPLSPPILITQGVSVAIVIGCAIALNRVAEDSRNVAKRHLMDEIIKAKGSEKSHPGQWESLLDDVKTLQEGAFRPFWQQPIVGAVLLPLSSVGWTTLLEKGILGL
jgi:hypothetical protein